MQPYLWVLLEIRTDQQIDKKKPSMQKMISSANGGRI